MFSMMSANARSLRAVSRIAACSTLLAASSLTSRPSRCEDGAADDGHDRRTTRTRFLRPTTLHWEGGGGLFPFSGRFFGIRKEKEREEVDETPSDVTRSLDELFHAARDVDDLFESSLFGRFDRLGGMVTSSSRSMVTEDAEKYTIVMDVPGVKVADLSVSVVCQGTAIRVSGVRNTPVVDGEGEPHVSRFENRVRLRGGGGLYGFGNDYDGGPILESDVSACLQDGVLTVIVKKRPLEKIEKDEIKIAVSEGPAVA